MYFCLKVKRIMRMPVFYKLKVWNYSVLRMADVYNSIPRSTIIQLVIFSKSCGVTYSLVQFQIVFSLLVAQLRI